MADFELYNKPICNIHGQFIIKLKQQNPQAFIKWKDWRQGRDPRGRRASHQFE